jgi:hypothetical protein
VGIQANFKPINLQCCPRGGALRHRIYVWAHNGEYYIAIYLSKRSDRMSSTTTWNWQLLLQRVAVAKSMISPWRMSLTLINYASVTDGCIQQYTVEDIVANGNTCNIAGIMPSTTNYFQVCVSRLCMVSWGCTTQIVSIQYSFKENDLIHKTVVQGQKRTSKLPSWSLGAPTANCSCFGDSTCANRHLPARVHRSLN